LIEKPIGAADGPQRRHEAFKARDRRVAANSNLSRALSYAKRGGTARRGAESRLLAFSRRQPLDPKPINLDHFLNGLQEFLQRTLRERIEVQTVGSAGLWAVEVDANHLESAIVNLAINARDAMPRGRQTDHRSGQRIIGRGLLSVESRAGAGAVCRDLRDRHGRKPYSRIARDRDISARRRP
jgi:signal transduction histidine kinase